MATGNDIEHRARLQVLLIDEGTELMRKVFDREVGEKGLENLLEDKRDHLKGLYPDQLKILYPSKTEAADSSKDFDISLLYDLLRKLFKKEAPESWTPGNPPMPPEDDTSELACIMRLNLFRNENYAHIAKTALSQEEFEGLWDELSKILIGLGGDSNKISEMKTMPITPDQAQVYMEKFEKLHQQKFEELHQQGEEIKKELHEIKDKVEELSISSKEPKILVLRDTNVFMMSVRRPLAQISNVRVGDELEEGNGTSDQMPTDDGHSTQQPALVRKRRKRSTSAAHIEETKENTRPLKEARPDAMPLSLNAALVRRHTGEEQHSDVHNRDFLTRIKQELAREDLSIEEKEELIKLKALMREYELEGIHLQAKNQIDILHMSSLLLSPESLKARIDEIEKKLDENGAEIVKKYIGCVILFLDFESKSRFENFWGFYTSGKLSDTVADLLATDLTSRLDSGDQLEVRAMVLEEAYIAWRDFFEKDESEEASQEQGATSQPTIHPFTSEPPIAAFPEEVQGAMAEALDPTAHQGQVNLEIDSKGTDSKTPSWTTEQQGSLPTVEMRISKGTDVNMEDEDGQTPLWLESKAGNAAAVEMLIAKGADVNKGDKKGRTPLWVASQNGHVSIVEMLITKGADANKADKEGRTPVWVASQNGHIPTIEMLISKGADVNKADEEGRAPLWVAAQKDDNLSTVEMLINKGANVNMADEEGRTSLWVASQNGCSKTVRLLISRGANVNMADNHSQTPLRVAAQGGHLPTVESLFREGADVNTIDEDARTPLWIASQEGHLDVVEMLLRNGANVNMEDKDGQPPLWIAAQEGHLPVVERLLTKGAVVNVADIDHQTPLSVAAQWGHTPVVKMLLSKGADVNMADKNGCTPLWIAALKGHVDTVEMLLSEGADVNMADNGGRTPLWIALQFGQNSTAEVLRSYGAVNMSDNGEGRRASFLLNELIAIEHRYMMRKGDDENVATKRQTGPTDVAKSMAEVVH